MCDIISAGSPWKVDIRSAGHVTTTAGGLGLVTVGKGAYFEVCTSPIDGNITVSVICRSCVSDIFFKFYHKDLLSHIFIVYEVCECCIHSH